eukprot:scaffold2178_cov171-Alexandrium_tamarense.AAC.11
MPLRNYEGYNHNIHFKGYLNDEKLPTCRRSAPRMHLLQQCLSPFCPVRHISVAMTPTLKVMSQPGVCTKTVGYKHQTPLEAKRDDFTCILKRKMENGRIELPTSCMLSTRSTN